MPKLVFYNERCTGCRVCEVVCSFHHEKIFRPKVSSIHVKRIERKGDFEAAIYREKEDGHLACDLCVNEKEPLCVRFCSLKALVMEKE